jgi:iron complex transport system permease protein
MSPTRRSAAIAGMLVLLALFFAASLMAGKVWAPLEAWTDRSDPRWSIIFELRLPRTLLAIIVGAALGLSGAAMQGYTRNSLADPAALGVSSMAALGAVVTLYFGAGAQAPWIVSAFAMVGAVAGVGLLMGLAGSSSSTVTFILAGVILQTVAGAGVTLALSLAPDPWAVNEIVNWLMGSLADRSIDEVRLATPFVAAGCALLLLTGRPLDALTLGETGARSMGINLSATRWMLAIGTALAVGASVAVTGIVGFVGLITPHLLRPLVGSRPSDLLWPSALGGAVLVLAADVLVRLTPGANEVRLGVLTAAIGGPFFFALLIGMRRRVA